MTVLLERDLSVILKLLFELSNEVDLRLRSLNLWIWVSVFLFLKLKVCKSVFLNLI